ncbi:MAG: thermonuclease family protein [Desulfovibrio sp.]|nr:thermonuclease family protein [Desulfovibrio sp.]
MRIKWPFALLLGLCLLCLCLCKDTWAQAEPANSAVARCFDGDTVKLTDRRVVRLAGIDAPELAHEKIAEQFYARAAQKELESIVTGHKISLGEASVHNKDRFGRVIAELMLEDGQSVCELMVRRGAAFYYPHKDLLPDLQKRLLEEQIAAIETRQGMWEELLASPVAKMNYIGNRDSLRFFPNDCPQAQKIKPRNRVYFETLMDAFLAGFAPSRVCPFWPDAR